MSHETWVRAFPHLFRPSEHGALRASFQLLRRDPSDTHISNVNLVPFVDDRCVVLRLATGAPEIPGGTREPGESPLATLRRELHEEAGGTVVTATCLGAWWCRSRRLRPYRPHLPHPISLRVVYVGDVRLVGPPQIPSGGEVIAEVLVQPVVDAVRLFRASGRPDLADLYRLAAFVHERLVA